MKNFIPILIVFLVLFYSCSTTKPTVSDKDNKLKNKTIDYYKESNEEALEKLIKENEEKSITIKPKIDDKTIIEEEVLVATSKVKVTKQLVLDYINKYRAVAIDNMNNYNIPASITLAQGILESGCGTSTLSITANNHFGIKCHANWEGETVTHTDDAPDECFRKYKNPRDSYRDHSLFLTSRKWYEPLFELNIKDYKAWSYGLKKSGYATDPKYPQKLISLIERYNLNQYDQYFSGNSSVKKDEITQEKSEKNEKIQVTEIVETKVQNVNLTNEIVEKIPLEVKIKEVKDIKQEVVKKTQKTHTVVKGDTLYNISKRYNITIEKLRTLNNITEGNINLDQVLIIE